MRRTDADTHRNDHPRDRHAHGDAIAGHRDAVGDSNKHAAAGNLDPNPYANVSRRDADAHANFPAHGDSDQRSDGESDADGHGPRSERDGRGQRYANIDICVHVDRHTHANTYSHIPAHVDADTHTHRDADIDAHDHGAELDTDRHYAAKDAIVDAGSPVVIDAVRFSNADTREYRARPNAVP